VIRVIGDHPARIAIEKVPTVPENPHRQASLIAAVL